MPMVYQKLLTVWKKKEDATGEDVNTRVHVTIHILTICRKIKPAEKGD